MAAHAWLRTVREQNLQPARMEMEHLSRVLRSMHVVHNAKKGHTEALEVVNSARQAYNAARINAHAPHMNCDHAALAKMEEIARAEYGTASLKCDYAWLQLKTARTAATKSHGIAGGCDG